MLTMEPYLYFDGNCGEAMRFYAKLFGGNLDIMSHADSPIADQVPAANRDRIMHARLDIDGRILMASDALAGHSYSGMHGFSIALSYPDPVEAKRVFTALSEGGRVTMPLQKTFWIELFGMVVDRFGAPWMINGGAAAPM
ncbi:MAG TPA: VOC family protein [Gemmatimonadales bacterium]|jgi:PhnB protein